MNSEGVVLSIDEGDIYGKREKIFNGKDWFLKKENLEKTKKMVDEILDGWDLLGWSDSVESEMVRWEFGDKVEEMKNRFSDFRNIVLGEL